jgi:hypothetical protein
MPHHWNIRFSYFPTGLDSVDTDSSFLSGLLLFFCGISFRGTYTSPTHRRQLCWLEEPMISDSHKKTAQHSPLLEVLRDVQPMAPRRRTPLAGFVAFQQTGALRSVI